MIKKHRSLRFISFCVKFNVLTILLFNLLIVGLAASKPPDYEDNEFAEFEELEETGEIEDLPQTMEEEMTVEDEDEEMDSEEFEISPPSSSPSSLSITRIPSHLLSQYYYIESILLLLLFLYSINYVYGRSINTTRMEGWMEKCEDILKDAFASVEWMRESDWCGIVWCSGRVGVEGMMIECVCEKRQDAVGKWWGPKDKLTIRVLLNNDSMDNFVFCVSNKKIAPKLVKEMSDLSIFCPDRKPLEKYGLSDTVEWVIMSESGMDITPALLDSRWVSFMKQYKDVINYIHVSDSYDATRNNEDTQLMKLPEKRKVMIMGLNWPQDDGDMMKNVLGFVFYVIDKLKRFKLSREAKARSDKNRLKVEESFLKATHAQRQELAQLKKEERRRAEKQKILDEEDPEKQRKLEEKANKKEMKRKTVKVKQLKVKAM